jgi:streptomycin 6-kinase
MIDVPNALVATHQDAIGRASIGDLPSLVAEFLDRWELRPDGPTRHGVASLVPPVVRADGVPAALKCQPVNDQNVGRSARPSCRVPALSVAQRHFGYGRPTAPSAGTRDIS